ncbi:hypothetical protein Tco_0780199 [Tanacetum coccineum]
MHDVMTRVGSSNIGNNKGRGTSENTTNELLTKLIQQLGNLGLNPTVSNSFRNTAPVTFHANPIAAPSPSIGPTPLYPPGFGPQSQASLYYYSVNQQPQFASPAHLGQAQSAQPTSSESTATPGQATLLPQAFTTGTLHDPSTSAWNMDTGASSNLNNSVHSLSTILNSCLYSTVSVGDGHSIPVTNTGHSIFPTPSKSLYLKNDFMTRRVLLRCDSTGDLYPITSPSPILHAFLVSQHTWHQRLRHPGSEVLHRLVSNNVISCNKEKPPVLCHVMRSFSTYKYNI